MPPEAQTEDVEKPRVIPPEKPVYIQFPMSGGNECVIQLWGGRISQADFDRLKKLIDLAENSLVKR